MVRRASPTTAAAVSALCLIVLAQSTLRPTATTSLPVQLGPSVSFQQHPPSTEGKSPRREFEKLEAQI